MRQYVFIKLFLIIYNYLICLFLLNCLIYILIAIKRKRTHCLKKGAFAPDDIICFYVSLFAEIDHQHRNVCGTNSAYSRCLSNSGWFDAV